MAERRGSTTEKRAQPGKQTKQANPTWKVQCTTYGFTCWYSNSRCTKKVCPDENCDTGSTPNTSEWLAPQTYGVGVEHGGPPTR